VTKVKYDGVIDAVHYQPDGQVDWVRAYLRRGPTYSDHVLVRRRGLVDYLKSGKKFVVGDRVPQMAGTFHVTTPIRLILRAGREVLVTGDSQAEHDLLDGAPVI
jgi:hypothetical protein